MDKRVLVVVAYMEENLHRDLPLTYMARAVRLSPWRLSHIFKSETGQSPVHYHHHIRMERARVLLETTPLCIKEIVRQVGMCDESHFRRNFKKTYGRTPAEWRVLSRG